MEAWRLFGACGTQWRTAGADGVPVGLDYPAVALLGAAYAVELDADAWDRVRVLEAEALSALNDRRERGRSNG